MQKSKPRSNIILYPMLTTSSLSNPTVLTVSKALERMILIYDTESVMTTGRRMGVSYYMKGRRLLIKEDWGKDRKVSRGQPKASKSPKQLPEPDSYAADWEESDEEQSTSSKTKGKTGTSSKTSSQTTSSGKTINVPRLSNQGKGKSSGGKGGQIKDIDSNISAEPTIVNVSINKDENKLLGIKVIPIRIKTDSLVNLLMSDISMKKIKTSFVAQGRKVQRLMWNLYSKFPFISKSKILTKNPKKDIILAKTKYREVVCLLNYNDVENQIFQKSGGISKLFKLGWDSIVVADEVQRIAYFCMKQFNGYCTAVNFSLMHSSLKQTDAFDSLEDVRSSSSSMFRIKKKASTLGERFAEYKLNSYKRLLEDKHV